MASIISEMESTKLTNATNFSDLELEKGTSIDGPSSRSSTPSSFSNPDSKNVPVKDLAGGAVAAAASILPRSPAVTIAGTISQAGRKKSNPAWEFFVDLREQGINAVRCRYCEFLTEDRSPSAMRLHIRKAHDTGIGGLWYQLEQKTLQQIPHKYTKSQERAGSVGRKRDSREYSNPPAEVTQLYDEAILAAAKAFLLQTQGSTNGADTSQAQADFINSLSQNPKAMHDLANSFLDDQHSASNPDEDESSPPSSLAEMPSIKTEVDPELSGLEIDESNSEMPVIDVSAVILGLQEPVLVEAPTSGKIGNRGRTNNWIHLGSFTNEADMLAVRTKEKVSKRRTEQLKNGIKVRYRCNKWKKTKCAFQMYAFYWPEGKIDLYESGEHDHSGKLMGPYAAVQTKPTPPTNIVPVKLSQEEILNNLLQQLNSGDFQPEVVTVGGSSTSTKPDSSKQQPDPSTQEPTGKRIKLEPSTSAANDNAGPPYDIDMPSTSSNSTASSSNSMPALLAALAKQQQLQQVDVDSKMGFILASGDSIASLLEIATDLELVFTFNSRTQAEYCFQSNADALKDRTVVLVDLGDQVLVSERVDNISLRDENWNKGDWKQFLWAVRGKCYNFLKVPKPKPSKPFNLTSLL